MPGSKSISNRALLLSALAEGSTLLIDLLDADDTRVMRDALTALGVGLDEQPTTGCASTGAPVAFPTREARLFLGNAGTAFRSLTAALAFAAAATNSTACRACASGRSAISSTP